MKQLLEAYRKLWNNRLLELPEESSSFILTDAIKRDLLDESTHPRLRKSKEEKYYFAVKRILESTISSEFQLELIKLHTDILEEMRK
ncbi:hypothetical protein [Falsibacillus albus]|uniref:Uncharacterized protein n=1 Tax=Falsibacillus albus TaxID=2478915 RepID=A0A3L7JXK6_9BACI|nr:hypothetical protein [Falsibacillus albus]RLQ95250.1 hypothetical protein D9X91_12030 [Falsibacillus albus]